jgi:hypothetical protein
MVRTPLVLIAAVMIAVAIAACRDIDEPPPLPVLDPDAPLDGGTDAPADGGLAGYTVRREKPFPLSFNS